MEVSKKATCWWRRVGTEYNKYILIRVFLWDISLTCLTWNKKSSQRDTWHSGDLCSNLGNQNCFHNNAKMPLVLFTVIFPGALWCMISQKTECRSKYKTLSCLLTIKLKLKKFTHPKKSKPLSLFYFSEKKSYFSFKMLYLLTSNELIMSNQLINVFNLCF